MLDNPDHTLDLLLALAEGLMDEPVGPNMLDAELLASMILDLDTHLAAGGTLPARWNPKE